MVYNSSLDDPDNMVGQVGSYFIILIIVVGTAGNVMVIMAVTTVKKLRTAHNFLIASLAVADLMMNTIIMPFYVYSYYNRAWNLSSQVCLFQAYFGTLLVIVSPFHIKLIAINRYFLISCPGKYSLITRRPMLLLQVTFVWLLSIFTVLPSVVEPAWTKIDYTDQIGRCNYVRAESTTFINILFIVGFVLPSLVIFVCYLGISIVIRNSRKRVSTNQAQNLTSSHAMLNTTRLQTTNTFSDAVFTVEPSNTSPVRITEPFCRSIISEAELESIGPCQYADCVCSDISSNACSSQSANIEGSAKLVKTQDNLSTTSSDSPKLKKPSQSLQFCVDVSVPKQDNAVSLENVELIAEKLTTVHAQYTAIIQYDTTICATAKAEEGISPSTHNGMDMARNETSEKRAESTSTAISTKRVQRTLKAVHQRNMVKDQQRVLRSFRMILIVFAAFASTYLPFTIVNLADSQNEFSRAAYMITALFFWTGSCVNPIIYGTMNRRFRDAYRRILCIVYRYLQKPINWFRAQIAAETCQ